MLRHDFKGAKVGIYCNTANGTTERPDQQVIYR